MDPKIPVGLGQILDLYIMVVSELNTSEALKVPQQLPPTSNISHTKSQNLNVSRLALRLPLPNPLRSGVKLRIKM